MELILSTRVENGGIEISIFQNEDGTYVVTSHSYSDYDRESDSLVSLLDAMDLHTSCVSAAVMTGSVASVL